MKLDLTRYTEQTSFTFDEVFDSTITNAQVRAYRKADQRAVVSNRAFRFINELPDLL